MSKRGERILVEFLKRERESFINFVLFSFFISERPAAIPVEVKSIDDTSNFDDFPDVELKIRKISLLKRGFWDIFF